MDSKNRLTAAEEKEWRKKKISIIFASVPLPMTLMPSRKKRADIQEQIDDNETELLSFFSKLKPLIRQYADNPSDGLLCVYISKTLLRLFERRRIIYQTYASLSQISAEIWKNFLEAGRFHRQLSFAGEHGRICPGTEKNKTTPA